MRVLIVDDEAPARRRLLRLLGDQPEVEFAGEAASAAEAVASIRTLRPDLVLLDVQMPDADGFSVVEELAGEQAPDVIFVTAYDHFAFRAFEVHALDYLLKPVQPERFAEALARARERLEHKGEAQLEARLGARFEARLVRMLEQLKERPRGLRRILVETEGRLLFVPVERVTRLTSDRNYVEVHTAAATYLVRGTLEGFAARLDGQQFVQVRRSDIVNLDAIQELQPWFHGEYLVKLKDGTELTWTRRYLKNAPADLLRE